MVLDRVEEVVDTVVEIVVVEDDGDAQDCPSMMFFMFCE